MSSPDYFDRDGKALTSQEWMGLFKDWEYRNIAQSCDTTRNKVISVSTVWLGLQHGHDENGRPLIFESLICIDNKDEEIARYCTQEEAIDGHRAICLKYQVPFDPVPPVKQFEELRFDSKDRWKGLGDE